MNYDFDLFQCPYLNSYNKHSNHELRTITDLNIRIHQRVPEILGPQQFLRVLRITVSQESTFSNHLGLPAQTGQ